MTKTITICDCCGAESNELILCQRDIRNFNLIKLVPPHFEICKSCYEELMNELNNKILRLKFLHENGG